MNEAQALNFLRTSLTALVPGTIILLLTWLIGNRFTYRLSLRQKRREAQLSALQQFYAAYGEFFAVWKLWNRLEPNEDKIEDKRWELHKRAAAAEAIVEGLLVRLSSELTRSEPRIETLGCFRQAFQQLRQSIRQKEILHWGTSESPEYVAFKFLAAEIATLLGGEWPNRPPSAGQAGQQLLAITSNVWERKWMNHHLDDAGQKK